MIYIIWGVCALFNWLYMFHHEFIKTKRTIRISDLFEMYRILIALMFGPIITFIIFLDELKTISIKIGNIEIWRAKK